MQKWGRKLPKTATERKAMQRQLNAAGVVHAAGWIHKDDAPLFCEMLQRAEHVVKTVEGAETYNATGTP